MSNRTIAQKYMIEFRHTRLSECGNAGRRFFLTVESQDGHIDVPQVICTQCHMAPYTTSIEKAEIQIHVESD